MKAVWTRSAIAAAAFAVILGCSSRQATDKANTTGPVVQGVAMHPDWKSVPLTDPVEKGIAWLVSVQGGDGGWGQDGGSEGVSRKGVNLESGGNDVANTALVCLALLRAGHTPAEGKHRDALVKGIEFILGHIEESQEEGIEVTPKKGTQIQRKLGPHIDTFFSNMLLAEVDGRMAGEASGKRVNAALKKVTAKIQKNQLKDGSWNFGGGWAPVLGTSIASRSLAMAEKKGVSVPASVMANVETYTKSNFKSGAFDSRDGAGVELYQVAQAMEQMNRTDETRAAAAPMLEAARAKFVAGDIIKGFGSMGGEEFVSYLNVSDSLVNTRGKEWTDWNGKIKDHIVKLQNQDGTWAGHHCITGRVACTSAAVMTLLSERIAPKL